MSEFDIYMRYVLTPAISVLTYVCVAVLMGLTPSPWAAALSVFITLTAIQLIRAHR